VIEGEVFADNCIWPYVSGPKTLDIDHIIPNDKVLLKNRDQLSRHKWIWRSTLSHKLGTRHSPSVMQVAHLVHYGYRGATKSSFGARIQKPENQDAPSLLSIFGETAVLCCQDEHTLLRNFQPHILGHGDIAGDFPRCGIRAK